MNPTTEHFLGRIVHYRVTESDAARINARRSDASSSGTGRAQTGYVVHVGNFVKTGDTYPMIITRVWTTPGEVNGQVFLDGNDILWVTSVNAGPEDTPGTYTWLQR